jgi:acyl carrier protein
MSSPSSEQSIKALLLSCLESRIATMGLSRDDVTDDFDMRSEGLIDSMGFVELLAELEERLELPLDFGDLASENLTVVGPLCRHIASQVGPLVSRDGGN